MPEIYLPTLHPGQVTAYQTPGRFKILRCGRRWGKSLLGETIACDGAAKGESIGWFGPEYKFVSEIFNEVVEILDPIRKTSSKVDGVIRTTTGGRIDFWTLDNERAGRSRKYHKVIIDEAAFTKPNMLQVWQTAIKPALLDYRGSALVMSTPNGENPENFFYALCKDPSHGFVEVHAPTHTNPYLPADELAKLEKENEPRVFRQEYLAEFVNWSGDAFFALSGILVNDRAVEYPTICNAVFAVIDTAIKTGKEHDGTAVSYYAMPAIPGDPVVILDYDKVQVEGSMLETWLPSVYERLEYLAKTCRARMGSIGAFIEDKASGTILLQQAKRRGWQATPIDSKLTAMGKDERAINVSGYVYRGMVKMSAFAYDKVITFKGITKNHFLGEVCGFRIGVKDQEDDLLDTFCYALAISMGNNEGF